ncbi:unnamed protein product, partial [Meganyctiphanes norvegica]
EANCKKLLNKANNDLQNALQLANEFKNNKPESEKLLKGTTNTTKQILHSERNQNNLKNNMVTSNNAKKSVNPYTSSSSNKETPEEKRTPYQGDSKAFGEFLCDDCDNFWKSPHTWANSYQRCQTCNRKIYPHRQYPPIRSGRNPEPHPEEDCEACQKLGRPCWIKKPHPQKLCEICIKLGRPCWINIRHKYRIYYNNYNEE